MGERCQPVNLDLKYVLRVARATARSLGATPDEADEAAQLTALRLWFKRDCPSVIAAQSTERRRWYGYIRTTARHIHYDLIRAHRRREDRHNRSVDGRQTPLVPRPGTVRSTPGTVSEIEDYLVMRSIADEIRHLPDRQRLVASLILIENYSIAEIANALEVQPQSVRKSWRAAKSTIGARLSQTELEWL